LSNQVEAKVVDHPRISYNRFAGLANAFRHQMNDSLEMITYMQEGKKKLPEWFDDLSPGDRTMRDEARTFVDEGHPLLGVRKVVNTTDKEEGSSSKE
jgi:hypothetical protein